MRIHRRSNDEWVDFLAKPRGMVQKVPGIWIGYSMQFARHAVSALSLR